MMENFVPRDSSRFREIRYENIPPIENSSREDLFVDEDRVDEKDFFSLYSKFLRERETFIALFEMECEWDR